MRCLTLCLTVPFLCLSSLYCDSAMFLRDDYSTHQPVLYAAAISTTGPIIEFGCGYGSTDLLHEICKKEGRMLITLDDNMEWLNKFALKYLGEGYNDDNSGWHKFFYVPGRKVNNPDDPTHWVNFMDRFDFLLSLDFDVCFIDQSPWLARFETLKRMKDKARFVVVHDVDYFPANGIFGKIIKPITYENPGEFDFSDVFSSFQVYFPNPPWPGFTGPPTLLGSNIESNLPAVDYSGQIVIEN